MNDTITDLARQVAGTVADLERLVSLVNGDESLDDAARAEAERWLRDDHGAEVADDADDDELSAAAAEVLYQRPLEVVEHATRNPGGEWERTHIVVVFAIGGPHIELDTKAGAVVGYWGGDTVRRGVAQAVCDWFEEWVA